jgi:DNA polymerase I-like protein with 3'-5' exonuclease and polymerase domains
MIDPELALMMIRESKVIASDTETSGLDPVKDFICGHVVTDHSHSVYVPVRHEAGGNIPNAEEFEKELAKAYNDRARLGYRTVFHNGGFDLRFYSWIGVVFGGPLEDSMINEGLIDDTTHGFSLDDCCARHQVTAKKGDELYRAIAARFGGIPDRKQMANFWRMPGDQFEVVDYATGDGVSTLALWGSQQPILDAEELRVPWQLECDLMAYVARLHRRGIRVDMDYAEKVYVDIEKGIKDASAKFPAGFNARSPKEVEQLFRLQGFTDSNFDRTETGKFSFTEKWLETNDIGSAILGIRRLEKARDSFVTPLASTKNRLGRVHAHLNQSKSDEYGAMGARFSCSEPNWQAFPKRNKEVGKIVRRLAIADAGMLFEEGDAMQQEPRFFTHYSQDAALLKGYREDPLFSIHHRANDMMFEGKEYDKAKRMAMGILSMMMPKALGDHLRISRKEAEKLRDKFLYDAFPDIGQFQADAVMIFENRGYVKSILGRRARMESRRFSYRAVSRIIQNSGGDHNKTCLLRAMQYEDAYPDKVQVLMPIHDSVIWQRDPGHDPRELVAVMENVANEFNLTVPIPFEVGSGTNWADASYGAKIKDKKGWVI